MLPKKFLRKNITSKYEQQCKIMALKEHYFKKLE